MSVRHKNIRITPAKLRAQRANARLSKGPRTREGRRRSALNRRRIDLSYWPISPRDDIHALLRVWRDLLAVFWFIKPEVWQRRPLLEFSLERVAWSWWQKLVWQRSALSEENLKEQDRWIEKHLAHFITEFRMGSRKADYWLRREFGTDGRQGMSALRQAIEPRLTAFREKRTRGRTGGGAGAQGARQGKDRSRPMPGRPTAEPATRLAVKGQLSRTSRVSRAIRPKVGAPPGVKIFGSKPNPHAHGNKELKL